MHSSFRIALTAAALCGFSAFSPNAASAMPLANVGLAPATEEAHAVRVCNRYRCWWTYAGHYHGRYGYGWRRPYYGHRYGWHGHRYGYGWRGHGWHRGYGWGGHWR